MKYALPLISSLTCLLAACSSGSSSSENKLTVELKEFSIETDTSEPFAVNHRIPVSFTLNVLGTKTTATESVPVTFHFVETNPADPENPGECYSNAINVDLTTNGEDVVVENVFIWPVSECESLGEAGATVALEAVFYHGEDEIEGTVSATLPELELTSAGVDVEYELTPETSVALLPLAAEASGEKLLISVGSGFVFNGADPYYAKIDASEIPEDLTEAEPDIAEQLTYGMTEAELDALDQLPGSATLTYVLIPDSAPGVELTLTIGTEEGTQESFTITNIAVGVADTVSHDLYAEGDTLAALSDGGDYDEETAFTLKGCITTDFTQEGHGDADANDCQEVAIVLTRETSTVNGASEITFNREMSRSPGNSRIGLNAVMSTENSLSGNGAFSLSQGVVEVTGNIGKSFTLTIADASAEAELTAAHAFYEAQVSAFGDTLYSFSDEKEALLEYEEEFSVEKETSLGGLGFGFGPIRLGFSISAGGRVGLTATDTLQLIHSVEDCQDLLVSESAFSICGRVAREVTPDFSMTGRVFGGLSAGPVSAGVDASLRFIDTAFPLVNELGFGITDASEFLVIGNVDWNSELTLISGTVRLVGRIKITRRIRRSFSVTLFSFSSETIETNLISESMGTSVKLL